jgi:hypothetical protein
VTADLARTGAPCLKGVEHHLYVIEISGVGVKVGISERPQARLRTHRRYACTYGFTIGRVWVSAPHVEARVNERLLMDLAGQTKREFLAIDFETAVAAADALIKTRAAIEDAVPTVSFFWPAGTTQEDVVRMATEVFR